MGSMTDFYTRNAGNEGVKLPLVRPDGTKTDDYLVIRSVDSDAFREAQAEANRNVIMAAQTEDEDERKRMIRESSNNLLTVLVKDWSFDEECTPENVNDFLTNAPHIGDQIDKFAGKRELFLAKKSGSSANSSTTKSKSTRSRKAHKSV